MEWYLVPSNGRLVLYEPVIHVKRRIQERAFGSDLSGAPVRFLA